MAAMRASKTILGTAVLALVLGCSAGGDETDVGVSGGAGGTAGSGGGGLGGSGSSGPILDSSVSPDASNSCTDSIDVVFVLDVSSSMGFVLDKLSDEIDGVVAAATQLTQQAEANAPHFGLIPFVDNHVIDLGGAQEGGMVHLDGNSLRNAFQFHQATFTEPNRNPGDGVSGPTMQNPICEENALDALYFAAKDFPWRPNATHLIIVATDDTFLERPDNYGDRDGDGLTDKTNFPREGDYPALWTVAETVDALKAAEVRVFAFTSQGTAAHQCGTGRRLPWEARAAGWSAPYYNSPPLPDSTDGANFDIELVRSGSMSLSETINDVVLDSHCNPPVY